MGYPALGKTSFFRAHFADAGYVHVNQDTLKTRDKCVKAADQALADGQSVVVGVPSHHRLPTTVADDVHDGQGREQDC